MIGRDVDGLQTMLLIRAFETALAARRDHGFQLLSSGEEAVAVGLARALGDADQLLTGGRSIGPALARGLDPGQLMAELLGRKSGFNQGRAGRGHLAAPMAGFFGAHAVVGGNISIAAGVALGKTMAAKTLADAPHGTKGIVAVLFGDGACGAGALHETLNIAALWQLPLLFVCNNNDYAVSTSRAAALAPGKLSDIGATFGLLARTIDGTDLSAVIDTAWEFAAHVRAGKGPAFLECTSIRLRSHSTTARETRTSEAQTALAARCPIRREVAHLGLDEGDVAALERAAAATVAHALACADASAYPEAGEVLDHVN